MSIFFTCRRVTRCPPPLPDAEAVDGGTGEFFPDDVLVSPVPTEVVADVFGDATVYIVPCSSPTTNVSDSGNTAKQDILSPICIDSAGSRKFVMDQKFKRPSADAVTKLSYRKREREFATR